MKENSLAGASGKRRPPWFAKTALEEELASGRCPLCWSLLGTERRYIFSFLYEGMMSGPVREKFLQGGGFCQQHFWQAKVIEEECWADGFGVAILCENLLEKSLADLGAMPVTKDGKKGRLLGIRKPASEPRFHLVPGIGCMACDPLCQ